MQTHRNRASVIAELDGAREVGYDLLRIYLGIGLLVRGAMFVGQPDVLLALIQKTGHWAGPTLIAHYVAACHICGGLLLILGYFTRLAAWAQVPALVGAVFFTHWGDGLLSAGQSLELAGLVLFMLLVFGVFGAGRWSLDRRLEAEPQRPEAPPVEPEPPTRPQPRALPARGPRARPAG